MAKDTNNETVAVLKNIVERVEFLIEKQDTRMSEIETRQSITENQLSRVVSISEENANAIKNLNTRTDEVLNLIRELVDDTKREHREELKPVTDFILKQEEKNRVHANLLKMLGAGIAILVGSIGLFAKLYIGSEAITAVEEKSVKFNNMLSKIDSMENNVEIINSLIQPK